MTDRRANTVASRIAAPYHEHVLPFRINWCGGYFAGEKPVLPLKKLKRK